MSSSNPNQPPRPAKQTPKPNRATTRATQKPTTTTTTTTTTEQAEEENSNAFSFLNDNLDLNQDEYAYDDSKTELEPPTDPAEEEQEEEQEPTDIPTDPPSLAQVVTAVEYHVKYDFLKGFVDSCRYFKSSIHSNFILTLSWPPTQTHSYILNIYKL